MYNNINNIVRYAFLFFNCVECQTNIPAEKKLGQVLELFPNYEIRLAM